MLHNDQNVEVKNLSICYTIPNPHQQHIYPNQSLNQFEKIY